MISVMKDLLFSDQGLIDDREPLFIFQLPGVQGRWGFFAPMITPWKLLLIAVLIQSIIQCAFAVIIYYGIIQRRGTTEAYLLGWGIIIPLSLYLPFYLLETLELHNRVVTLGLSTIMSVIFFRSIEAMYGTTPLFVANSLSNYVAYYSSIVPFVWDPTTEARQKISLSKLQNSFLEIAGAFSGVSLLLSVLKHYDYRPFPSSVALDRIEWTWEIFSPNHIANAYLHAWLIFGTLKSGFELSAFNENIKGYETHRLFDQPFLKSQTPTEFWTKRWNMLTRPLLKHGIFLPIREYSNPSFALFITFVVSGLYHEYVWYCIFYDFWDENGQCRNQNGAPCYDHRFGRVLLFFAYVGVIMLLERPMGKLAPIQWISQHSPRLITAHLLLLLHLPIGYWYYGDWIVGGYFDHFAIVLWQIKRI